MTVQAVAEPVDSLPLNTLPLNAIQPSDLNPRKRFDEATLQELASSIEEHGLLQNIVVRSHPNEDGTWQIVAGERRYRALQLLVEEGKLEPDYQVPITIREVSDFELLMLATAENIQRSDMTPLEEADAFAQLVKLGDNEEAIALRTGVALSTVKMRLKLSSGLCADARRALEDETITLSQAQALLLASKGLQKDLLPRIIEFDYSSKDIKRLVTQDRVPVGRNIFPLEAYTAAKGAILTDIFQPEHQGWFDDRELFIRLQNEAVEQKLADYQEQGLGVEVERYFMPYKYEAGEGVVVILNDYDFSVEFREGYVKRPERQPSPTSSSSAIQEAKPKQNRRRDRWESTTLTRALHEEASKDFRLCLILNVMALLGVRGFDLERDEGSFGNLDITNRIFSDTFKEQFAKDLELLTGDDEVSESAAQQRADDTRVYLPTLNAFDEDVSNVFETLKAMEDDELQSLFSRLTTTLISHTSSDTPWNTEVKRLVARETGLEVKEYFDASDKGYLSLHTKAELAELAGEAGVVLDVSAVKKSAAVDYLAQNDKVRAYVPERLLLKAA